DQCDAVSVQRIETATHDVPKNCRVNALFRKTGNRHGGQRSSCHGPDIVDGVQSSDATIVVTVIHYWREKVHSLHNREIVGQSIHSGIVGFIKTNQEILIERLWW